MAVSQKPYGVDVAVRAGLRSRSAMRRIDPAFVARLGRRLACRKPDHVMAQLGISLNTWDKLRADEPIRASVADRLLDRFRDFEKSN